MKFLSELNKSKVAKTVGLALGLVLAVSFVGFTHADETFNLTVNVSDNCGPVVAQAVVVNGPDDGAFVITDGNGNGTLNLHAGVFYLHVSADGHDSADTGAIVLTSDQSVSVNLNRQSSCGGNPPPTPTMHNLTVRAIDTCSGIVAQAVIVNGPDDGAFGITNSDGYFTFNLHDGVFYVHFSAADHGNADSDTIVLNSDQSIMVRLPRSAACPGSPVPPPVPNPTPTPTPAPTPVPTPNPTPAPTMFNLSLNVSDNCGPVVAQAVIVNGPDDGAFGISDANGHLTLNLHAGVFYIHFSAANHASADSGTVVLNSNQSYNIFLNRNNSCPGTSTPPQGYLDLADCTHIAGWSTDFDTPNTPVTVEIYKDGPVGSGFYVTTITANAFRADVGAHAFDIPTPSPFKDTSSHQVFVYALDTANSSRTQLSLSPKTIGPCVTVTPPPAPTPTPAPVPVPTPTPTPTPVPPPAPVGFSFHVIGNCNGEPIGGAFVSATGGNGTTDAGGNLTLSVTANTNINWNVSASGYNSASGTNNSGNGGVNVNVTLNRTCPTNPPPPPIPVGLTFHVRDNCTGDLLGGITVKASGTSATTDLAGNVTFTVNPNTNINWSISASGYNTTGGTINSGNGGVNVNVTLVRVLSCVTPPPPPVVPPPPAPNPGFIQMTKVVRDLTQGQTTFVPSISANPGDVVEFRMQITASNGDVKNVLFSDSLPTKLVYVNNSLTLDGSAAGNNLSVVNLGDMTSNQTRTILLRATVADSTQFSVGSTALTNLANATSSSNSVSASAVVIVNVVPVGSANLTLTKNVRNLTQGGGYTKSISANANDQIQFQIQVSVNGSISAQNVTVNDILPSGLNLVSGNLNNNFGTMSPGSTQTFVITAQSANTNFCGTNSLVNTANATSSNAGGASDSATVSITGTNCFVPPTNVNLILSKTAYNQTRNADATQVIAQANDVIVYTLHVQNTGNAAATNFVFQDDLSDVLKLSHFQSFGGGAFDMGNLSISWPAVTIPANGSMDKTFSVIVNSGATVSDNVMTNIFGNTVNVRVAAVAGIFIAPPTGPVENFAISAVLALLTAAAVWMYRKQNFSAIIKFLTNSKNV